MECFLHNHLGIAYQHRLISSQASEEFQEQELDRRTESLFEPGICMEAHRSLRLDVKIKRRLED